MLTERSSSEETKIALKGAVLVSLGRQDKREVAGEGGVPVFGEGC